jgi:hypothetical protein
MIIILNFSPQGNQQIALPLSTTGLSIHDETVLFLAVQTKKNSGYTGRDDGNVGKSP